MFTNAEVVSRIKNQLRLLTKDDSVNDRFILYTARNITTTYLSQKLKDMSLYREEGLYTTVECLEFEEVNPVYCGVIEFKTCKTLMRTNKKLPELIYSRFGNSISELTSVDYENVIEQSSLKDYRNNKKRQGYKQKPTFFEKDQYLYIPDYEITTASMSVLSLDLYDLNELSACGDDCRSAWDYNFVASDKLLKFIIDETVQSIMVTKQIPEDENPNLNNRS